MKIDVVIGNPPYQEQRGCNGSIAVYHYFMELSKNVSEMSSLVVPARWLSANPKGISAEDLEKLRRLDNIEHLVLRDDSVFSNVNISGGVCYYLYNEGYNIETEFTYVNRQGEIIKYNKGLNINGYIIKDYVARQIIQKIQLLYGDNYIKERSIIQLILGSRAFTSNDKQLNTNWRDYKVNRDNVNYIRYYNKKDKVAYVKESDITASNMLVPLRKIYLHLTGPTSKQVINKPFIGDKYSVCSRSYTALVLMDDKEIYLDTYINYIKTKWFRFMISAVKTTQHANRDVYTFIPMLTDEELVMRNKMNDEYLYKKYSLSEKEINYIESNISSME